MKKTERLEMINEMLKTNPSDPFLKYAAALEFKKNGDKKKSIELLGELIQQHPKYLAAYYQLGKLQEESNNIEGAIKIYRSGKIIAQEQNDTKTLGELSEALEILDANE